MTIRFAVIGTGKITESFIDAAMQDSRFVLQAVYSRQQATAEAFAERFNIPLAFDDLSALANCNDVDAVYVASPNSCHASQAMLMMQANKHVLCEKPVAVNNRELSEMIALAKQHNVCFMEAMLNSFLPNFLQVKQAITQIGTLRKFSASFCQYSSRYLAYLQGATPNTFNLAFANGALMDLGIYPLYLAINMLGRPDEISFQCTKLASGVDGCGELLLNYQQAHQMQAAISYSKISNGENLGELQGENGRIVWQHSSLFNKVTLILNNGHSEELSLAQNDNRMTYEIGHFLDLIQANKIESPINSWQLSTDVLTVIEQARQLANIKYPNDN